jgi:hypothetical protein
MMMIEGLIGHLHEDVLGAFRGNVRVPEPRGVEMEILDFRNNPFPGADVIQPPYNGGMRMRFHQIKSKMGSAKGGDGMRLGQQLRLLAETYDSDIYYDALIGKSLSGHRSRAGVQRAAPKAIVLVGQAALQMLTGSPIGGELLLHVYQTAFKDVARSTGYNIQEIAAAISAEFRSRATSKVEDFLHIILNDVISGDIRDQDSRTYIQRSRRNQRSI